MLADRNMDSFLVRFSFAASLLDGQVWDLLGLSLPVGWRSARKHYVGYFGVLSRFPVLVRIGMCC